MNRKIFTAITFLALILINSLFFLLEHGLTATFWITFTFVWVAFISSYSFQMLFWHKLQTPEQGFLLLSSFTVTIIYELMAMQRRPVPSPLWRPPMSRMASCMSFMKIIPFPGNGFRIKQDFDFFDVFDNNRHFYFNYHCFLGDKNGVVPAYHAVSLSFL